MTTIGAQRAGSALLLAVAAGWGLTFFSTKSMLDRLPVTDFLAVRFGVAAVVLVLIAPKALRMRRALLWRGAVIGLVFAAAQLTQTFALPHTSASTSGFVTGLYVLFVPLLGAVMFKVHPNRLVWVAIVLALVGLAVLSMRTTGGPFGVGEWVTLISAALWGLHITLVGRWSRPGDVMSLTIVQTVVAALVFLAGAVPDGVSLPSSGADWVWMAYFAIIIGAGGELAQFWAQARVEASKSAVLMVTEPLWAALFAVLWGGESVTWRLLAGGGIMVAGMVLAIRATAPPDDDQPATSAGVEPTINDVPTGTADSTDASPIGPSS